MTLDEIVQKIIEERYVFTPQAEGVRSYTQQMIREIVQRALELSKEKP